MFLDQEGLLWQRCSDEYSRTGGFTIHLHTNSSIKCISVHCGDYSLSLALVYDLVFRTLAHYVKLTVVVMENQYQAGTESTA